MKKSTSKPEAKRDYAAVNGLRMYYEIHGTGKPLVLLHGSMGVIATMFGQLLPALAKTRQVIAVELQAHGHTADIDRPFRFEQMADDTAALLHEIGVDQADLCGFSLGGMVAWQAAIRHPEVVRKLVVISAPCKRDGWYPEDLAGMSAMNAEMGAAWIGSPMQQAYAAVAPSPDHWPVLVGKMGQLLRQSYDWSAEVAAIRAPTLIVVGDSDGVRLEHAADLFRMRNGGKRYGGMGEVPSSQLAVLPGTTHMTICDRVDLLLPILAPFLDAPMG